MKLHIKYLGTAIICVLLSQPNMAQNIELNETKFTLGGYAKMDVLFSRFYNGEVPDGSPMRDFYFPSLIPVGPEKIFDYSDFHVKESRFNFDIRSNHNDHRMRAFMEMDFMLSGVGNEKISNSFNPRLRHFFFEYDNFLLGQTWSTFMVVILPEDLDFIGVPEGLVFIRQPQLRITVKNWQFALENPTTTVTTYQSTSSKLTSSGGFPDFVVRRNLSGDWGTLSIAAIFRNLNMMDTAGVKRYESGYGITMGSKIKVGKKDDIRFATTAGEGLGRYIGLNFVTSSVLGEKTDLHAIRTLNGYFAYQHQWAPKLASSFNVAGFIADQDDQYTSLLCNKSVWSASANLLYTPVSNVLFGIEWMHAVRELECGDKGSFDRVQVSGRYSFKYER